MKQIGNLLVVIRASTDQLKKELSSAQSQMKKFASDMKSAGRTLTTSITLPLMAVSGYAIKMAMDVEESENLFRVSMGNMADAATEWSNDFAEAMGMNQYAVRKNLGTFKLMIESMGVTETAAYGMSKSLTELAYDMASLYNIKVEEAFDKLHSGIVGMPRPLQDLGIVINETTVEAWALAKGLIQQGQQMTESQKVIARYGTIMETTSKAQGDLARTIESPTNQLRILKDQIELAAVELGKSLLPSFTKMISIGRSVVEFLRKLIDKFNALPDSTKNVVFILLSFVAALGPMMMIFGSIADGVSALMAAFKLLLSPAGLITAAILILIGTLIYLYNTNEDVKNALDAAWKFLGVNIPKYISPIIASIGFLIDVLMGKNVGEAADRYNEIVEKAAETAKKNSESMKTLGESFSDFFKGLKIDLPDVDIEYAQQNIKDLMGEIEASFKSAGGIVTSTVDDMTDAVKSLVDSIKEQTKSFMSFVGMFDIFERKYVSGERLLRRMKAHVQVMKEWQMSLSTLQQRGVDTAFISELRAMGPGAVDSIKALVGLSQEKLMEYVGLWRQQYGMAGAEATAQVGFERGVETYIANQINMNITGNRISNTEDVDRIANQIITKLRLAGINI